MISRQLHAKVPSLLCADELENRRPSWKDWIFAESRRRYANTPTIPPDIDLTNNTRTAIVYLLIDMLVDVTTNVPCPIPGGIGMLPLPSSKTLWEAESHKNWSLEYDMSINQRIGNCYLTYSDLHTIQKGNEAAVESRPTIDDRLESWYSNVDSFGTLVIMASTLL